jgi:hypothetical protein
MYLTQLSIVGLALSPCHFSVSPTKIELDGEIIQLTIAIFPKVGGVIAFG